MSPSRAEQAAARSAQACTGLLVEHGKKLGFASAGWRGLKHRSRGGNCRTARSCPSEGVPFARAQVPIRPHVSACCFLRDGAGREIAGCRSAATWKRSPTPTTPGNASEVKTLIIGLGNPIVSDDSVGLRVVAEVAQRLADRADVEVTEDYWGGLRLMERMVGFRRAIVVDAIQTGSPPGTIHRLTPNSIPTQRSASAHDVNLATALELGRQAGLPLPANEHILLVAVEADDVTTFGEQCTPAVQAAIPAAVEEVLRALAELQRCDGQAAQEPAQH